MECFIKLNSQTNGKDKVARLIQYLSRALWDSLKQNDVNGITIDRLKTIEYILSSFRKLLRFGKCFEIFYGSLKSIHQECFTLRFTLTLSKIAQGLYLYCDHIIWLSRTGLFKQIDAAKWNKTANKYWLFSIVMNLCRDFYEIIKLIDSPTNIITDSNNSSMRDKSHMRKGVCSVRSVQDLLQLTLRCYVHQAIFVDTIKNLCDFFIPFTSLGYTKLSPRTIGILGVISSMAGLIVVLKPTAKLIPS